MAKIWFYRQGEKQFGPFEADELRSLAKDGRLKPSDLVSREGLGKWVSASSVKGLFLESQENSAVAAASASATRTIEKIAPSPLSTSFATPPNSCPPKLPPPASQRSEVQGPWGFNRRWAWMVVLTAGFVALGLVTLLAVLLVGRGDSPVESFGRFAALSIERRVFTGGGGSDHCPMLPIRKQSWDVRKTDSLTKPYVGTLAFTTLHRIERDNYVLEADVEVTLEYAREINQFDRRQINWVFQTARFSEGNWWVAKHDDQGVAAKAVDELNKQPPLKQDTSDWQVVMRNLYAYEGGFPASALTELTESEAARLGRAPRTIDLSGLTTVEPEMIRVIRQVSEEGPTWRNGLNGHLKLNGLRELSDALADELAKFKGDVELNGLEALSLTAAKLLANHSGNLSLKDLRNLEDSAAIALSQHRSDLNLGVATLPEEAIANLCRNNRTEQECEWRQFEARGLGPRVVILENLQAVSQASAELIASSPCAFKLSGLLNIDSGPLARALLRSANKFSLNIRAVSLSDNAAAELASYEGFLFLPHLEVLESAALAKKLVSQEDSGVLRLTFRHVSADAAAALAAFGGDLSVNGLITLAPDEARGFASHKGKLSFSMRQLSAESAKVLALHDGPLVVCFGRLSLSDQEKALSDDEAISFEARDALKGHKGDVRVCFFNRESPISQDWCGGNGNALTPGK